MGIVIGVFESIMTENISAIIVVAFIFTLYSLLVSPILAFIFFPVVLALNALGKVSRLSMCISGALGGVLLGFILHTKGSPFSSWPIITYAIGGVGGGYSAFSVLRLCARSDNEETANKALQSTACSGD